jgi:radical SAM superfamily enzyme YgiQ (UPF0313 family)
MAGRLPFSIMHLHAYLKNTPFEVRMVDERVEPNLDSLIADLDGEITCFGISSFTGIQIHNGLQIAVKLKTKFPKTPVVWGGWHPSCMADQTLKHPLVDIVVRGQGEETFKELLGALSLGNPLAGIKGLSYKAGGKIFHNPDRDPGDVIKDLRLSYDLFDVEKYIYKQPWGDSAIGMITSLGCPFNCGFCAVACVYKRHTFYRDVDIVLGEIDYLVEKYRINAITFDDDNFFVSAERVKEFCRKLQAKPYKIAWDAGAHVGLLLKHYDDEALRLVRNSGCQQLYIGAESGSDEVLTLIEKKATVAQTLEYVKKMKEAGIRSFLSTMVCFPGVSEEDIYSTMDMILECRDIDPDLRYRLFYYTPYPATPLYQSALDMGMKEPQSLEEWSQHTLRKFHAPWITKAHRRHIKNFYFYYYPYSAGIAPTNPGGGLATRALKGFYSLVFENILLVKLAKWRVRTHNFSFPADAAFALFGQRLRSFYNRRIRNQPPDLFHDYDD